MRVQDDLRFVYVTTKDVAQAKAIGQAVVEAQLAACVNVLPGMTSIYRWEGKIETAEEAVLIVKTTFKHLDAIIEVVKKLHTYEVPCALVLPVLGGNDAYVDWLRS